ncbi:MAG: hypothetical protein R3E96_01990 [Planctomycetota bacterium]
MGCSASTCGPKPCWLTLTRDVLKSSEIEEHLDREQVLLIARRLPGWMPGALSSVDRHTDGVVEAGIERRVRETPDRAAAVCLAWGLVSHRTERPEQGDRRCMAR